MAVKIRLMRTGRKGQPYYRIVAVDSRKRRDGAYLELIGHYNPNVRPAQLDVHDESALKWLRQGAVPSDTVRSLLSRQGLMLTLDLEKRGVAAEDIQTRVAQHRLEKEASLRKPDNVVQPVPAPALETKIITPSEVATETAEIITSEPAPSNEESGVAPPSEGAAQSSPETGP